MSGRLFIHSCRKLSYFNLLPRQRPSIRLVDRCCVLSQKLIISSRSMSKNSSNETLTDEPGSAANESKKMEAANDSSKKMTGRQKLSLVFAEYGVTAVVFHTVISLTSLGLCYLAVSSGLDIPGFLIKIGISESLSQSIAAKGASTFVIAYACHKVFMPVRIFMTVTCTPLIVHRLRGLGLIK